ncbi:MAG: hypothetical protein JWM40_1389 [Frankiales bacterium]|nr:hypothetical protein [Frankiales bacterium]
MTARLRQSGGAGARTRALAVLALAAPMVLTLLLATAPTASASGSFTSNTPDDGAVLGGNSFTVGADISQGSNTATLTLTGVDAGGNQICNAKVSTQNGGAFSRQQTISLSVPSSACPSGKNARWNATLSGGASGGRSFATNAAPATPSSFSADGSGARDVSFTWSRGDDVDLTGYSLFDGAGNVIDGNIGFDRCNGSLCSYALYYPADNPGTHSYALSSRRTGAGCSGCASEVESGKATASATLVKPPPPPPPPPTPSPTPSPTPTGGTGGSTTGGTTTGGSTSGGSTGGTTGGGSTTGGSSSSGGGVVKPTSQPTLPSLPARLAAARRAFAISFNAFSPSLGIPKLPPLPANFAPSVSPEAPLPLGTYSPQLPYKAKTETVKTTSVIRSLTGVGTTVDYPQLAKALAVAMILMLVAAHLRRFLAVRED